MTTRVLAKESQALFSRPYNRRFRPPGWTCRFARSGNNSAVAPYRSGPPGSGASTEGLERSDDESSRIGQIVVTYTTPCGREDSNLHPRRDRDLNPARLPISPRPRGHPKPIGENDDESSTCRRCGLRTPTRSDLVGCWGHDQAFSTCGEAGCATDSTRSRRCGHRPNHRSAIRRR